MHTTVDYSSAPDGEPRQEGDLTLQVVDGVLVLRSGAPGPLYAKIDSIEPTPDLRIEASIEFDPPASPEEEAIAGPMITNLAFEGYALTCGSSGNAYLLVLGAETSWVLHTFEGHDCTSESKLALEAAAGGTGDMVVVELPDGHGEAVFTGISMAPFTDAGFMGVLGMQNAPVEIRVRRYTTSTQQR